jgi:predicted nucleotidyltransferase component of viral defense system
MLEQSIVQNLAKNIQIAPEHIAREAYEILILHRLGESDLAEKLVFKGGTALRLAYGSPRFSEDLDFSLLAKISIKNLDKVIQNISQQFSEITIADISDKRWTHFALLKIKEDFLHQTFSIKIEISKRLFQPSTSPGYTLTTIESQTSPLTVFMQVFTPEEIFADKIQAVQARIKPRDLFDLWFLAEKLKKPLSVKIKGFTETIIRQELNKYLPRKYHYIVKMLIKKYANNRHPTKIKKTK